MPESLSRIRGVMSEITFIAPIRKDPIPTAEEIESASTTQGPPLPIRFADRLRLVLESFNEREDQYDNVYTRRVPLALRAFGGIHFAHLALIDCDTRLLFSVDFDGSPHDYLAGLAHNVPWLLELVFSNCEGWEPVAGRPEQLIRFVEAHQVRTHFWYAHMPGATVRDLEWFHELGQVLDELAQIPQAAEHVAELRARVARRTVPLPLPQRIDAMFEAQQRAFSARDPHEPESKLDLRAVAREQFKGAFGPHYSRQVVESAVEESLGSAGAKP